MEYVLETERLCKRYRSFKALDNLNMHVPKGAIYGFIGKNGAGKTTLIRLITGLQHPSDGRYQLLGIDDANPLIHRARKRTGAVVETPSVYLELNAMENMRQQYMTLGLPSEDGMRELLHLVGLDETGNRKVKDFSLGIANGGEADAERRHFWNRCDGVRDGSGSASSFVPLFHIT